eukprot:200135_1
MSKTKSKCTSAKPNDMLSGVIIIPPRTNVKTICEGLPQNAYILRFATLSDSNLKTLLVTTNFDASDAKVFIIVDTSKVKVLVDTKHRINVYVAVTHSIRERNQQYLASIAQIPNVQWIAFEAIDAIVEEEQKSPKTETKYSIFRDGTKWNLMNQNGEWGKRNAKLSQVVASEASVHLTFGTKRKRSLTLPADFTKLRMPYDVELEWIDKLWEDEDSNMKRMPTEENGDCMFQATAIGVYSRIEKHEDVRADMVKYMERHSDEYKELFVMLKEAGDCDDDTWNEYLMRIAENGEWGDSLCLRAISAALKVSIIVHKLYLAEMKVIKVIEVNPPDIEYVRQIHILRVHQTHYEAVLQSGHSSNHNKPQSTKHEGKDARTNTNKKHKQNKNDNANRKKNRKRKTEELENDSTIAMPPSKKRKLMENYEEYKEILDNGDYDEAKAVEEAIERSLKPTF